MPVTSSEIVRPVKLSEKTLYADPAGTFLDLLHRFGKEVRFPLGERPMPNLKYGVGLKRVVLGLDNKRFLVVETDRLQKNPFSDDEVHVWLADDETKIDEGVDIGETFLLIRRDTYYHWSPCVMLDHGALERPELIGNSPIDIENFLRQLN